MNAAIAAQLAPTGTLRAAINLSNFLLVSSRGPSGEPQGVAPDMARAVADAIGVPIRYITFPTPGELADAVAQWDIGLIGAEPQRAEKIAFSAAYAEIEATYLVPAGSPIGALAEVDRPGVRIAVSARSAYGLWLDRNIRHATLHHAEGLAGAVDLFADQRLDVLAGLLPALLSDTKRFPGSRILAGHFSTVQQAIGTPRDRAEAAAFLADFVESAKASGLVARLIERHGVQGLSVAASAG
ncbi:MAG TPA: transporter substrate-binding domain-containing protein [Acetobacteraceae bacterium]|nr:transporter substrate-binding domain-containing protein [Acetobacteraceae bacterium]